MFKAGKCRHSKQRDPLERSGGEEVCIVLLAIESRRNIYSLENVCGNKNLEMESCTGQKQTSPAGQMCDGRRKGFSIFPWVRFFAKKTELK